MNAQEFVSRLDRVRQTGANRWLACCPAHEDKRPSLSVHELSDGRTLVHCFAGCDVDEITRAIGLTVSDLFPPKLDELTAYRIIRVPRIPASDVLTAVSLELEVLLVAAADLSNGQPLNDEDHARVRLAAQRLRSAVGYANGRR